MGESSATEPAHPTSPAESAVDHSPDESASTTSRKAPLLPAYAALAIAVIAVALAALAYFRPAHHSSTGPAQQSGDAKTNVCSAFATARKGVVINTHLQGPDNNLIGELSVAANARLSLVGGGAYLHQRLAANSGAPAELGSAVDDLANTMQQLGASYLAGAAPDVLDPLRQQLDTDITRVAKACT